MFNSVFIDTRMRAWEELVLQQVHFEFFWGARIAPIYISYFKKPILTKLHVLTKPV